MTGGDHELRAVELLRDLLDDAEGQLDAVADDLTDLYQRSIPMYDTVDRENIRQNTRAVLDIVLARVRADSPMVARGDVIALVRLWADQSIPLEFVAHSFQLGARRLATLVRERAVERTVSSEAIDQIQDMMWDWATSYAASINEVINERAVSGAARRADFVRRLVEGGFSPAQLREEARAHAVELDRLYTVACMDWDDSATASDARAALRVRCTTGTIPVVDAVVEGLLVALLPVPPTGPPPHVAVGVGNPVGVADAATSFRQATGALRMATATGVTGHVTIGSLGPLPLVALEPEIAEAMAAAHMRLFLDRGEAGREVLDTVAAFLDNDRRVDDTAAALFVHRNTVRNRVARFEEITGLDIDRTGDLVLTWWLLRRDALAGAIGEDPLFQRRDGLPHARS